MVMCTNAGMHVMLFTGTCLSHLQSRYLCDNRMVMLCFVFMCAVAEKGHGFLPARFFARSVFARTVSCTDSFLQ